MAFPEQRWIGLAMVGIGLLVFLFDVRVDRGHIEADGHRFKGHRMIPLLGMIGCGIGFLVFAGFYFRPITPASTVIPQTATSVTTTTPNISFQKFALFWVMIDKDIYSFGILAKFFNSDAKAYLVNSMTFTGKNWALFPRGGYLIRRLSISVDKPEILEDNYMRPTSEAYFKKLLPIKIDMTISGGKTPEIVLRGDWVLSLDGIQLRVNPNLYSSYPDIISMQQWHDLLKPVSKLNIEDFHYINIPWKPLPNAPDICYLVYSPDRSATIDNPYFAQTPSVKGEKGIMLFIRGKGDPPLDNWYLLGRTYHEVWTDSDKLSLYNSLFPPDENGLPRPFGFFAGAEREMSGPVSRDMSAPTTRAADIMEFPWPQYQN